MVSQRVERTWICTGGYGRFRGEWVKLTHFWLLTKVMLVFGTQLGVSAVCLLFAASHTKANHKPMQKLFKKCITCCSWWSRFPLQVAPEASAREHESERQSHEGKGKKSYSFFHCPSPSLRKQPAFGHATTGFPAKWRLRNELRNSILMTRHFPDLGSASDWLCHMGNLIQSIRSTTQIWVVMRHQYETSGSFTKCLLFSQATHHPDISFCVLLVCGFSWHPPNR